MSTIAKAAMLVMLISLAAAPPTRAQGGPSQDAAARSAAAPGGAARIPATQTAAAGAALSLQEARSLALSRSPALAKARLAVDVSDLAAQAQAYAGLPQVSASAGGDLGYDPSGSSGVSRDVTAKVSVSQLLYDGGKNSALVKKGTLQIESDRKSLQSTRLSVIGQTDAAFYAALKAEASARAAESDLASAQLKRSLARAKADAAILSKSALLQTEADAASYQTALLLARKNLASARAKLASLTGLPASTALRDVDFSSYDALIGKLGSMNEASLDALAARVVASARASNPGLAGYSLAVEQARLAVSAAQASYLPSVSLGMSGGLSYSLASGASAASSLTAPTKLSIAATVDLDAWRLKNGVAGARAAASQAAADLDKGGSDLDLQVVQALYEWVGSAASIGSSAKALEYAESSYQNVLEQYRLSAATTSDLSSAEATVSVDRTALINARYSFLENLSALAALAGLDDPTALAALVP